MPIDFAVCSLSAGAFGLPLSSLRSIFFVANEQKIMNMISKLNQKKEEETASLPTPFSCIHRLYFVLQPAWPASHKASNAMIEHRL